MCTHNFRDCKSKILEAFGVIYTTMSKTKKNPNPTKNNLGLGTKPPKIDVNKVCCNSSKIVIGFLFDYCENCGWCNY